MCYWIVVRWGPPAGMLDAKRVARTELPRVRFARLIRMQMTYGCDHKRTLLKQWCAVYPKRGRPCRPIITGHDSKPDVVCGESFCSLDVRLGLGLLATVRPLLMTFSFRDACNLRTR